MSGGRGDEVVTSDWATVAAQAAFRSRGTRRYNGEERSLPMSTEPLRAFLLAEPDPPPLENGDRMTQAEFHRRYQAYPKDVKFELIGGIVFMASPLRRRHGNYHNRLGMVFGLYEAGTPG